MAGAIGRKSEMKIIACAATAVFLLWATPARAGPCVDADVDGICDTHDNCVPPSPGGAFSYNPGQADTDGDFCGNVCDPDFDQNGQTNIFDLLLMVPVGKRDPAHDMTEPNGNVTNVFDIVVLLSWIIVPPFALPAGPSGTTPGTPQCPL